MALTAQQAQQIQAIAAQVEVAWREITKTRTALSFLIQHGKATCTDIKTYNLLAKSTYFYQRAMADTIRGAGGQAPVSTHPGQTSAAQNIWTGGDIGSGWSVVGDASA